jgi:hypothetical protein
VTGDAYSGGVVCASLLVLFPFDLIFGIAFFSSSWMTINGGIASVRKFSLISHLADFVFFICRD